MMPNFESHDFDYLPPDQMPMYAPVPYRRTYDYAPAGFYGPKAYHSDDDGDRVSRKKRRRKKKQYLDREGEDEVPTLRGGAAAPSTSTAIQRYYPMHFSSDKAVDITDDRHQATFSIQDAPLEIPNHATDVYAKLVNCAIPANWSFTTSGSSGTATLSASQSMDVDIVRPARIRRFDPTMDVLVRIEITYQNGTTATFERGLMNTLALPDYHEYASEYHFMRRIVEVANFIMYEETGRYKEVFGLDYEFNVGAITPYAIKEPRIFIKNDPAEPSTSIEEGSAVTLTSNETIKATVVRPRRLYVHMPFGTPAGDLPKVYVRFNLVNGVDVLKTCNLFDSLSITSSKYRYFNSERAFLNFVVKRMNDTAYESTGVADVFGLQGDWEDDNDNEEVRPLIKMRNPPSHLLNPLTRGGLYRIPSDYRMRLTLGKGHSTLTADVLSDPSGALICSRFVEINLAPSGDVSFESLAEMLSYIQEKFSSNTEYYFGKKDLLTFEALKGGTANTEESIVTRLDNTGAQVAMTYRRNEAQVYGATQYTQRGYLKVSLPAMFWVLKDPHGATFGRNAGTWDLRSDHSDFIDTATVTVSPERGTIYAAARFIGVSLATSNKVFRVMSFAGSHDQSRFQANTSKHPGPTMATIEANEASTPQYNNGSDQFVRNSAVITLQELFVGYIEGLLQVMHDMDIYAPASYAELVENATNDGNNGNMMHGSSSRSAKWAMRAVYRKQVGPGVTRHTQIGNQYTPFSRYLRGTSAMVIEFSPPREWVKRDGRTPAEFASGDPFAGVDIRFNDCYTGCLDVDGEVGAAMSWIPGLAFYMGTVSAAGNPMTYGSAVYDSFEETGTGQQGSTTGYFESGSLEEIARPFYGMNYENFLIPPVIPVGVALTGYAVPRVANWSWGFVPDLTTHQNPWMVSAKILDDQLYWFVPLHGSVSKDDAIVTRVNAFKNGMSHPPSTWVEHINHHLQRATKGRWTPANEGVFGYQITNEENSIAQFTLKKPSTPDLSLLYPCTANIQLMNTDISGAPNFLQFLDYALQQNPTGAGADRNGEHFISFYDTNDDSKFIYSSPYEVRNWHNPPYQLEWNTGAGPDLDFQGTPAVPTDVNNFEAGMAGQMYRRKMLMRNDFTIAGPDTRQIQSIGVYTHWSTGRITAETEIGGNGVFSTNYLDDATERTIYDRTDPTRQQYVDWARLAGTDFIELYDDITIRAGTYTSASLAETIEYEMAKAGAHLLGVVDETESGRMADGPIASNIILIKENPGRRQWRLGANVCQRRSFDSGYPSAVAFEITAAAPDLLAAFSGSGTTTYGMSAPGVLYSDFPHTEYVPVYADYPTTTAGSAYTTVSTSPSDLIGKIQMELANVNHYEYGTLAPIPCASFPAGLQPIYDTSNLTQDQFIVFSPTNTSFYETVSQAITIPAGNYRSTSELTETINALIHNIDPKRILVDEEGSMDLVRGKEYAMLNKWQLGAAVTGKHNYASTSAISVRLGVSNTQTELCALLGTPSGYSETFTTDNSLESTATGIREVYDSAFMSKAASSAYTLPGSSASIPSSSVKVLYIETSFTRGGVDTTGARAQTLAMVPVTATQAGQYFHFNQPTEMFVDCDHNLQGSGPVFLTFRLLDQHRDPITFTGSDPWMLEVQVTWKQTTEAPKENASDSLHHTT